MNLRPYQSEAIASMRQALVAGQRRVVLYSPTGSGKTEMAMEFIRRSREKAKRVLFVANRIELVSQAVRRFAKSGIHCGVMQGENTRGVYEPVLAASIHTLDKRGIPSDFDLVIVDEAHAVAGSKAYLRLLQATAGKPVIGLSATPFSAGLGRHVPELGGPLFQEIVKATTIRELIDMGFLVDVEIYGPSEPDLSGVKTTAGDYNEKQLAEAVDKPALIGDIVTHWMRLAEGKQTVVFAVDIAHAEHIAEQFRAVGVVAEAINCYTPEDDRNGALRRFADGSTTVLCNVSILAEGWDCPSCEVMILARPTQSLIRYIQMAGRVLRPAPGKTRALMLDHSGTVKRLGFPTDDLPLELDDGKRGEKKPAKPKEALPTPCPACTYVMAPKARACVKCGLERKRVSEIEAEDGDLVAMNRIKTGPKSDPEQKRQTFAELLGYARQKGYQDGWAAHKHRELFGAFPAKKQGVAAIHPSPKTLALIRHLQIRQAKAREKEAARAAA